MKQVHAFLRHRRAIPVICYLVAFLVWLLLGGRRSSLGCHGPGLRPAGRVDLACS